MENSKFPRSKAKYSLENKDLYRYLQLSDYVIKEIRPNETINKLNRVTMDSYKQKVSRSISAFHRALDESREESTLNRKDKL